MAGGGVTLAVDSRPQHDDNVQGNDTNECIKNLCSIPWAAITLVLSQFVLGIIAVTLVPDFISSCKQFGWETDSWFLALIIGLIIIGTFDIFIAIFNWLTSMHCLDDGCGKHCILEENYDEDGEERNAFCGKNMIAKCCGDWMQWFVMAVSYIFSLVFATGSVMFTIGMAFSLVLHGACAPYLKADGSKGDTDALMTALVTILKNAMPAMKEGGVGYIFTDSGCEGDECTKDLKALADDPGTHCDQIKIQNTAQLFGIVVAMCCVQYHLTIIAWGNIKGSRGAEVYRQKAEDMIAPQQRAMKAAIKNTDL